MLESMVLPTARLRRGRLELIDQTLLPGEYRIIQLQHLDDICEAIRSLRVRGAPAIGVAAAYGLLVALGERLGIDELFDSGIGGDARDGIEQYDGPGADDLRGALEELSSVINATRPTAVNLSWALSRLRVVYNREREDARALLRALQTEADAILSEDIAMCMALGRHGAELIADGNGVLTHCNTGGLATGGFGTALGVVFAAFDAGKSVHVYADETRPLLQGARLTAWECQEQGVPVSVLADGAAASLLSSGKVALAIVGADRIAANGDAANKIGTLGVAIAANRYGVPFYVAAPSSTIDTSLANGLLIPIEQRGPEEVTAFAGNPVTPPNTDAYNPAFDVTPAGLISAIITENGVHRPPYRFDAS